MADYDWQGNQDFVPANDGHRGSHGRGRGGYRSRHGYQSEHGHRDVHRNPGGHENRGRGGRGNRGGRGDCGGRGGRGNRGGRGDCGGRGGRGNRGGHESLGAERKSLMQYLSDEELQALSQGSPDDVLVSVNENESKFLNTFKRRYFCHHPLKLKQMIKLLHLLVQCEDKSSASKVLVHILCADGEYALFTTQVDQLLKGMVLEMHQHIRRENLPCIDRLIDIGQMAIKTIPSTVVMTYPVPVMEHTIQELQESGEKMDVIATKFAELSTEFRLEKKRVLEQRIQKQKQHISKESQGEPPEPFTEVPILPSHNEMHMDSKKVFLRSNIVKGGYTSWDHYFDVQFRLLREDFLRPLRKGIDVFSNTGSSRKTSDIRVYEGARVLNPVCLFTGIGFQLHFDSNKLKNVNWEHSRRLIFGSLLCLSNDEFDRCMLFATVVKRDAKLLKDGLITIKFENDVNGFKINPKETYTMVESTAYYEAYRHILEGLQDLSRIPDAMPMKKYIVACNMKSAEVPQFLRIPSHPPRFNMGDILGKSVSGRRYLKIFDITDHSLWPPAECTHLDSSQLRALEMALTKEVSVIQGPPGTGKTYIGHKIVEAYLKNRAVWDPQKTAPILVVCYTNHALDQFLEGIHKLSIGSENDHPNIIRVGGRCKSEELATSVLSKKVQECLSDRSLPRPIFKELMESRHALFDSQRYINSKMENCDSESKQNITSLSNLMPVMYPLHIDQLLHGMETTHGKEMEVWLNLWFPETMEQDMQHQQLLVEARESLATAQAAATNDDGASSSDEELINVDNEARILEEERMIEGEELELPANQREKQGLKINASGIQLKKKKDKYGWKTVQPSQNEIKKNISQGFRNKPMTDREASKVKNIWRLKLKQRWMLYLVWINKYIKLCKDRVSTRAIEYDATCTLYSQSQKKVDCFVAQSADVIGMTTTGAAKYHHLLKEIHPKIVIFEEAAEILEAHVVTSLASSVQQLVMIGDHKQLRPKPTCYDLEKDHNLDVSLFERLILNDFEHVTLENQHRMRPEISKLIHPTIYETLYDAETVKKYDHVKGVSKDVFFIDHTQPEEPNDFNDTKSHVNKYEAEYIVELCHYLLKQEYSPSEITILTMYRGQLLELRKRMKREHFEGVRVAAVDDFQGEENEIILLSLVRSNSDKSIGFLKIENRVCVSLSRAKQGLYVIGNSAMLRDRPDTKWPEIIHHLETEECVGYGLPLFCPVHPEDKLTARNPDDFRKRPEGGCIKVCGTRLPCGHACARICHPKDREHKTTSCFKPCGKLLPCGHNCTRKCYQCKKQKTCSPCSEDVEKTLPKCGHIVKLKCLTNPLFASCPLLCEKSLPCGHKCQSTCSVVCTTHCMVKVRKQLPCGHNVEVNCFKNVDSVICPEKCNSLLECGDKCSGTCGKCQHGRLHIKCLEKCGRDLVCGHPCKYPCASICPPCEEKCGNYCYHSDCPKKCYEPCDPCMEPCRWSCPHFKCTKPCGELCNRPPCNQSCKKLLECGHPCIGLCGEKCPKKCRVCFKDEVCEIFFGEEDEDDALFVELQDCGHFFEVKALDNWINTDTSNSNENASNSCQVQFKACPKCKTSIRKSLRYGNVVKQVLRDVESIKRKQAEAASDLQLKYEEAVQKLPVQGHTSYVQSDLDTICQTLRSPRIASNWYRATAVKFQLSVLPTVLKLKNLLKKLKSLPSVNCSPEYLKDSLSVLKRVLMQDMLSSQQISDCTFELRRLNCAAKLLDLLCKIREKGCAVSTSHNMSILNELKQVYLSQKLTEEKETEIAEFIQIMSTRYNVDGLSQKERIEIVNAIGLSKGHWFKCSKGHFYCIGECGGAMQQSRCPECGNTIGGRNHTLESGNEHAGEIDGSRYAAWSDAANMVNFDPADLARLQM